MGRNDHRRFSMYALEDVFLLGLEGNNYSMDGSNGVSLH